MSLYQEGDPIPAWCDFRPVDGGAIDPTTIYFAYTAPGQSTETVLSVGGGGLTMLDSVRATVTLPTYGHPGNWVGEWYVVRAGQHQRVAPWAARVEDRRLDLPTAVPDPLPTDSTSGNPWAPYRITTTDATPTRLVRIPLAVSQAVYFSGDFNVFGLSSAGTSTGWRTNGVARRIGSATPVGDANTGSLLGPPGALDVSTSPYPLILISSDASLAAASVALVVNADSIDVVVTGVAGQTIRWGTVAGSWSYL